MNAIETAKRLGVSRSMVYKLLDQGRLAYHSVGSRKVISAESVEAYILRNTHKEETTGQGEQKAKEKRPKKGKKVYRHLDL